MSVQVCSGQLRSAHFFKPLFLQDDILSNWKVLDSLQAGKKCQQNSPSNYLLFSNIFKKALWLCQAKLKSDLLLLLLQRYIIPFFKVLIKKKPARNSVKFYVPWKRKCNMLILALPRQKSFAPRPRAKHAIKIIKNSNDFVQFNCI